MDHWTIWFTGVIFALVSAVNGDESAQTDVFPKSGVTTFQSGERIRSIWKLEIKTGTVLSLKAWTEAEEKMIQTGCNAWRLNFRLHGGSPSLPYSLWEGAKEQISPQLPAWLNDSFELGPIASGSNDSNELVHTIDFGANDGNQFLTSWIDQDVELQPLKRRIQDKLGISTQCRPLIQFNLTNSNNQSENEVLSDVNISQNISGFRPLSKNNLDAGHKVSFFFNDTLAEVPVNCVDETKNKFFFKIDGATDVGGTLDFVIFNATTQMCLTQNRPDANNV